MGVPQLFKTMTNDNDVLTDTPPPCKTLYLDYNCLVHYVLHQTDLSNVSAAEVEETVITKTIAYTRRLSNDIVKPTELLYIALDGPVPNTKLCKQRERRFKKQFDEHVERNLNVPKKLFNSNAITPGTAFMQKLHERIRGMIELKSFHVNVEFSDSNEAGEGEFKVFSHIRRSNQPLSDRQTVVYGMDADLIVLCMVNGLDIHLCREDEKGQVKFLPTLQCLTHFMEKHKLLCKFESNPRNVLLELVLVFMFGGNDFVFPFHFTRVRGGGIRVLLRELARGNYALIDSHDNIRWTEVRKLLANASKSEGCPTHDEKCGGGKDSDLEFYHHGALSDERHPLHAEFQSQIIINTAFWKPEYYQHTLRIEYSKDSVDAVCEDYLNSVMWCWSYYVHGIVPSWTYCYSYLAAPPMSDLVTRMSTPANWFYTLDRLDGRPPTTFAQLLTVLPRTNNGLLPTCFSSVIKEPSSMIAAQYPHDETKIKFEMSSNKMIYATPVLPAYDLVLNQQIVHGLSRSFTSGEHKRNCVK